jgi:NADPH-dependent 2,4-dienoyl-CoA reductase/sulfur reductase-like enzyme/nitrite reductase/ring-hydroxylating ferredoxin subunit
MGKAPELKGPDLTLGVLASEVPPGGLLLGHAHGKPVVVASSEGELFAVGAVCTHYSGPLDEGIVADGTIRCPWHHACFSLKTGAPSAPAFEPIPCYHLVRNGDRISVGEAIERPTPATSNQPARVVIVGAGPAGAMVAEALRRFGHQGSIVLCGAEATPPVDRTNLSKDFLAGTAPEEWMLLRGEDYYREHQIDFRTGRAVVAIDREARTVELEGSERVPYDALVLATGAEPVRLPVPGGMELQTLRTLADSRAIIAKAKAGQKAVIIGASFIGLEVAASLRARDVHVRVIGREEAPLAQVLGPELSQLVRGIHEEHGVQFHLGRTLKAAAPGEVSLDDGTRLEADFVVAGVGVKPRTDLAEKAGLGIDRGIVVDELLCAAPGIYAIGDVARYPERRSGEKVRIEHWVVAQRQGEAVARTLIGQPTPFRSIPFFWSAHYDLTINYVGHAPSSDRIEVDGDLKSRDAAVHYYRKNKLLAVATVGRDKYALEVARRFELE